MTAEAGTVIRVECEQRSFPPYDAFHGTPDAMLWRRVTLQTPRGEAIFEQTDYGHAGQMNPWVSRGVATGLLPRLGELRAVVEAVGELL